jgi:hypothetical protein
MASTLQSLRNQSGLLRKFGPSNIDGIGIRLSFPRTLRKLPEAALNRIAILLHQMNEAAIHRRDHHEIGLLDHSIESWSTICVQDVVFAYMHPSVLVDDA